MEDGIVLGIDAGGSKTLALAGSLDGKILGSGQAGPANFHSAGLETAYASMNEAVRIALSGAGSEPGQVRAICIGAAGADRAEDRGVWVTWTRKEFPGAIFTITNDAIIVLAAGTPEGWGLVVISGTGSIAYGRDRHGRLARAGGWGYLMGDEGSNYAIGQAALRAITRAMDGRAPQTALVEAVLAHWKLEDSSGLVRKVYASLPRKEIVGLGRLVEAVARSGDAVAAGILDDAAHELSLAARAVVDRLELADEPVPCALAGSVLVYGQWVRPVFLRSAEELGLRLDPVTQVAEPARGAVKLALEELRKNRVLR
jgi:N-acetylmuramic acid 6-phosphate etherase